MYNINSLICYILLLSTFTSAREDLHSNATSKSSNVSTSTQISAEGGVIPENARDKTHLSREHVTATENNTAIKLNNTLIPAKTLSVGQSVNKTSNKTDKNSKDSKDTKPVVEKMVELDAGVSKTNDEKSSVGKKGVNFSDTNSTEYIPKQTTSGTTNTSAPIITKLKSTTKPTGSKKPVITVHDDFVSNDAQSKKPEPDTQFSSTYTLEKKSNRANYVIPIVAVILSVPLVAIIISVLYKRGQDWWQHRNYRRMDFLIEGMYNN